MEQYKPNLGELCGEDARRDAVHVAVVPLVASQALDPGDHFWLDEHGQAKKSTGQRGRLTIGVADPYYDGVILKGERFWGLLYPNTITELRHVWSHPAFQAKPPLASPVPSLTEDSL